MVTEVITIALPRLRPDEDLGACTHRSIEGVRSFIAGPENCLVSSAVEAVRRDAVNFSPLVLYGPSGCGKSHLLQGLAATLLEANPEWQACYCTGSDFGRKFAEHLRHDPPHSSRNPWSDINCMVVDNIQELVHFPSVHAGLISLLDQMQRTGGCFLASCRENPSRLDGFSPELRSRLSPGLVIPVVMPEQSTRQALIHSIAQQHNRQITQMAASKLAAAFPHGLMQLSGIIHRLMTCVPSQTLLDIAAVDALIHKERGPGRITLKQIALTTAKYFRVKVTDLKGASRRQSIVQARSVAMALARQLTDFSLKDVGKHFGGRDHTTVMHAVGSIQSKLKKDVALRQAVSEIREMILARSVR